MEYRIEHDTMGEVRVPVNALYRAQTQRAVENFPISGTTLERAHIAALAQIKKSAAHANAALGVLKPEMAEAIAKAADAVMWASTTASSRLTSSRPAPVPLQT